MNHRLSELQIPISEPLRTLRPDRLLGLVLESRERPGRSPGNRWVSTRALDLDVDIRTARLHRVPHRTSPLLLAERAHLVREFAPKR